MFLYVALQFNRDMNMQSDATRQQELAQKRGDARGRQQGERLLGKRQETLPATTASPKPPHILSHPQPQTLQPLLALGQQADLSSCAGSPGVLQLSHFWHRSSSKEKQGLSLLQQLCF